MHKLQSTLDKIKVDFLSQYSNCEPIIYEFWNDMNKKISLKMLNTFIFCNTFTNTGEYLALDFGGSNVRISLYQVENDVISLKDVRKIELRGNDFDYTTSEYSIKDIFEMITDKMEEIIDPNKEYLLGHTFSFAMQSVSANSATLLSFSKGFELKDSIGKDVNECLKEVIDSRGLKVIPVAILNDTTATLLTGFMRNKRTNIACIIGTGHNICFVDSTGEVVNVESGAFNSKAIPLTEYDRSFLAGIPNESECLCEALVGGKNSAKLANEIITSLSDEGLIDTIHVITPKMLSMVINENLDELDEKQNYALREVSKTIYERAAYIVACEIAGIFRYLNIKSGMYNIAFDGSVYQKTPYFGECLTKILDKLLNDEIKITNELVEGGSSIGAAIACMMSK